jgi:hypothetical protein
MGRRVLIPDRMLEMLLCQVQALGHKHMQHGLCLIHNQLDVQFQCSPVQAGAPHV